MPLVYYIYSKLFIMRGHTHVNVILLISNNTNYELNIIKSFDRSFLDFNKLIVDLARVDTNSS